MHDGKGAFKGLVALTLNQHGNVSAQLLDMGAWGRRMCCHCMAECAWHICLLVKCNEGGQLPDGGTTVLMADSGALTLLLEGQP